MNFIEKRMIQNLIEELKEKNSNKIPNEVVANTIFQNYMQSGKSFDQIKEELESQLKVLSQPQTTVVNSKNRETEIQTLKAQKQKLEAEKQRPLKTKMELTKEQTTGKRLLLTNSYVTSGKNGFINLFAFIFIVGMSGFCCLMYMVNMILLYIK